MKKYLFLILFPILMAAMVQAQTFGVKAGLTMADINYINFDKSFPEIEGSFTPGLHLAVFVPINLSEYIRVQPEIGYIQRGTKVDKDMYMNTPNTIHYLNASAMMRAGGRFGLELGPEVSYFLKGNNDLIWQYNSIDYGVNTGLYFRVIDALSLNVRYYFGLQDFIEDVVATDENGDLYRPNTKNKSFNLSIEYTF
jgi:hypothetical protein